MTDGIHGKKGRFDLCAFCPDLCLDRCPVVASTGSVTYSPFAKMLHGWLIENGRIPASEEVAELFYQCTGCLSCHEACAHDVDVETSLFDLRAELVDKGIAPYGQDIFEVPTQDLIQAQSAVIPKRYFVPEARAVLFPGCHALLDRPGLVKDVLAVFRHLNIEFIGASDEAAMCCGYPLHAGGYRDAFLERAEEVSSALRRYRMVVTLSPCCEHTMKNLFAAAGVSRPPVVTSALDIVAPLVMRTEREPLGLRLSYHDSCFLGRHMGQYDLPREVITHVNGLSPIEMRMNRGDAACCGAGGGWDRTSPVLSGIAASSVIQMADDAGADVVVSASSTCASHLDSRGDGPAKVMDLFSLIAAWLKPKRSKPKRRRRR
ncbi:MAG: (Fe-S)-binding protein [Deltaproteobacteria bacterium]|nr:(Fe-S)-binding protein [Deltaproteobacteria bacterium]